MKIIATIMLCLIAGRARSAIITTVAGTGTAAYTGDGGTASTATLNQPVGVAVGPAGSFFIDDLLNHCIRKVDASGTITTFAGNGNIGFAGDGGPATAATLFAPYAISFDTSSNLFIADTNNHRIRKVDVLGIITTVAGNGSIGTSGDGGLATSAAIDSPLAVAAGLGGKFYFASANYIRMVNGAGIISTVGGTGTSGYSGDGGPATAAMISNPAGIVLDSAGNLFIADGGNRVRKIDLSGTITTVAGTGVGGFSGDGGLATAAKLDAPYSIALNPLGELFITDRFNCAVRKVDAAGIITTVAGIGGACGFSGDGGPATSAHLHDVNGVSIDAAGNLYVSDDFTNRIRKIPLGVPTAPSAPVLHDAYAYPNPAVGSQNPTIRVSLGVVKDVQFTIFDSAGRKVHGATLTGTPTGIAGGEYYYDYTWTGSKSSGAYFVVIHGHAADGTLVKAKTKFLVVR